MLSNARCIKHFKRFSYKYRLGGNSFCKQPQNFKLEEKKPTL